MDKFSLSQVGLGRSSMARLSAIAQQLLTHSFGRELFSTPALEMLLDLYMRPHPQPRSLTGLTAASSASERNSLRIIHRMVEHGLLARYRDVSDGRRVIVELTPKAIAALDSFFDELVGQAEQMTARHDPCTCDSE